MKTIPNCGEGLPEGFRKLTDHIRAAKSITARAFSHYPLKAAIAAKQYGLDKEKGYLVKDGWVWALHDNFGRKPIELIKVR